MSPLLPDSELRMTGDCHVGEGATVRASLHVAGHLTIGARAILDAPAVTMQGANVGDGARAGDLTVEGDLHWGHGASARSVSTTGAFVTTGGHERATSLVATGGIHPGVAMPRPDVVS